MPYKFLPAYGETMTAYLEIRLERVTSLQTRMFVIPTSQVNQQLTCAVLRAERLTRKLLVTLMKLCSL